MDSKELEAMLEAREREKEYYKQQGDPRSNLDRQISGLSGLSELKSLPPEVLRKFQELVQRRIDADKEFEEFNRPEMERLRRNKMAHPSYRENLKLDKE